jgi:hypothetical protein
MPSIHPLVRDVRRGEPAREPLHGSGISSADGHRQSLPLLSTRVARWRVGLTRHWSPDRPCRPASRLLGARQGTARGVAGVRRLPSRQGVRAAITKVMGRGARRALLVLMPSTARSALTRVAPETSGAFDAEALAQPRALYNVGPG